VLRILVNAERWYAGQSSTNDFSGTEHERLNPVHSSGFGEPTNSMADNGVVPDFRIITLNRIIRFLRSFPAYRISGRRAERKPPRT